MRKLAKIAVGWMLLVQLVGAAAGAFAAIYYGPEIDAIVREVLAGV